MVSLFYFICKEGLGYLCNPRGTCVTSLFLSQILFDFFVAEFYYKWQNKAWLLFTLLHKANCKSTFLFDISKNP